jgi:hypothetical protein
MFDSASDRVSVVTQITQVQLGCCDGIARPSFAPFPQSPGCRLVNTDTFLTCDANWGKYVTLQLSFVDPLLRPRVAKIPLGNSASPVWAATRPLIVRPVQSHSRSRIVCQ